MTGASYVDYLCWALNHEGDRALLVYPGRRITWRAVRESAARHAGPLRALGQRPGGIVAALAGSRPAPLDLRLAVRALGGRHLPQSADPGQSG
jgi:acyl-coenzyme A synthetase/AMP-(fatty) acid ligase